MVALGVGGARCAFESEYGDPPVQFAQFGLNVTVLEPGQTGVGARGALRRKRGEALRLEAGVRDGRAVPARATAELGSLIPWGHSRTLAQASIRG